MGSLEDKEIAATNKVVKKLTHKQSASRHGCLRATQLWWAVSMRRSFGCS